MYCPCDVSSSPLPQVTPFIQNGPMQHKRQGCYTHIEGENGLDLMAKFVLVNLTSPIWV
jgi:hypothetical protein